MDSLAYYNANATDYYTSTVHLKLETLYAPFLNLLGKNKTILDLGCGSGRDSKYFLSCGHTVTSVDGSKELIKLASRHIGKEVLLLDFNELDYKNEFDGIWACASLLHIPKKEISHIFKLLAKALKPEGYLFTSFKHGSDEIIIENRLFNNYTATSFSKFISGQTGFKTVKIWKTKSLREDRNKTIWLNLILKCTK